MNRGRFCGVAFALALFLNFSLSAQNNSGSQTSGQEINAILTAVPFLTISPDSRHGALGDAGVAIADNANATHWNLSALAFNKKKAGVSMSYTPWLRTLVPDVNLGYLSGFVTFQTGDRASAIGTSLRYFSLGKIEFTDENAIKTGEFNASEWAYDIGYTIKVTDNLSAGVALRYIFSNLSGRGSGNLQTKPGKSFAGDINMLYSKDFTLKSGLPLQFNWGLNVSNIGAKISYTNSNNKDFLPGNLRLGWMLKASLDEYNTIAITNDFNKLLVPTPQIDSLGRRITPDQSLIDGIFGSFADAPGGFNEELREINISVGAEYWYNNLFAARAGFFFEPPTKGNRKYITLGAGLRYQAFGLDFAYLASLEQNHPLQNTLRFTLMYEFDPEGDQ